MKNLYNDFNFMRHHIKYLATSNPLYLWASYLASRQAGGTVPDHILEYLDQAAKQILNVATKAAPKRRPEAVMAALGLSKGSVGKGSPFAEYKECMEHDTGKMMAATINRMQEWGEGKADYVFEKIAEEYGTSKSTVRRHYMALQNAIKDLEKNE